MNTREWALLIWLSIAVLLLALKKDIRASAIQVLRAFIAPAIVIPVACLVGWIALEVWCGFKLSLWKPSLLKDTVVWFLVSGLVLFFGFTKASSKRGFYRRRIIALFGITEFLAFFTNLYVLGLAAELVLQPVLIFVGLLSAVAALDPKHAGVKRLTDGCLSVVGLGLLVFAVIQLVLLWGETDKQELLLQLSLPIWLTIGLLPFIYLISLYANYEKAFKGINWASKDRKARWRARLALISKLRFRTRELHAFAWSWAPQLTSAPSVRAARQVVDDFLKKRRDAAQAVIDEQKKLRRYAGSDELDSNGRRLDRREFKETTAALRWLATCHMGWYPNKDRFPDDQYRPDLLDRLGNDFTRQGLPPNPSIEMRVSSDGQKWYAWRRTVTGWCFAIGAAGPPPDKWEYDGPEPPQGFPGEDPCWGAQPHAGGASPNWT